MCGVSVTVLVTTLVLLLDKSAGACGIMDLYQPWNQADPCVSQCSDLNSMGKRPMRRPRNNFCCNVYNFDCILDCKKLERGVSKSMDYRDDAELESVVGSAWEDTWVACECQRRKPQELEMQQPLGKQQSLGKQQPLGKQQSLGKQQPLGKQQSLGKQATLVSPRMQTTSPPLARKTTRINHVVQPTSLLLTTEDTKIVQGFQPTPLPLVRVDSKMDRSQQPTSPPQVRVDSKMIQSLQPTSLPLTRVDSKMDRSLQPTSPPQAGVDSKMIQSLQPTSLPLASVDSKVDRSQQPTSTPQAGVDSKMIQSLQPTSLPLARVDSKIVQRLKPTSPPVEREATIIARSVGLDLANESFAPSVKLQNLRVVSETRGEDTVSVLVAWEPVPSSASGLTYQVSWQPEEDAVRGNLLTDTPSTTLSLLPDTIYDLKISVAGPDAHVGRLVVDTHPSPLLEQRRTHPADVPPVRLISVAGPDAQVGRLVVDTHPSPHSLPTHILTLSEETAGAAAALILLMGLLFAVRWCNTRTSKVNEQLLHSDHFKEFPPPVTLLVASPPSHESSAHLV